MIGGEKLGGERGTTLVELMVGLMAGMAILTALTTVLVVTLHGSARVSARVEATQRARVVLTRIMEELHSACVAPQIAPIRSESTGTSLVFWRASGSQASAVAPQPTKTVIKLENGLLTQTDFAWASGLSPNFVFSETGTARRLLTKVRAIAPSTSIFTYYKYSAGSLTPIVLSTSLGTEAASTIQVKLGFAVDPERSPVADAGMDATLQDSAPLRLTPPSVNESAAALPCQ
jgi:Tfp pilus assembly protein PilW